MRQARLGLAFVMPAAATLLAWVFYPLVNAWVLAFHQTDWLSPNLRFVGFGNFQRLLADPSFRLALWNTVQWTAGSVVLQVSLGLITALVLWPKFWARDFWRALILVPWIAPSVVSASTWAWMLHSDFGIVNAGVRALGLAPQNWLGQPGTSLWCPVLVNVWKMFPFVTLMLSAGLEAIPVEVLDAAAVDGASSLQTISRIVLPMLRPVLGTIALLLTIWAFNAFTFIYVMTRGGPANSSEILSLFISRTAFQSYDFGLAAAAGVVLFLCILLFTALYLRLVLRGLAS